MGILSFLFGKKENSLKETIEHGLGEIKKDPDNWENYAKLGTLYERLGDLEKMKWCSEKCIELTGGQKGYSALGWAYYRMNRLEDSKKAFQAALNVDPENKTANSGLGLVLHNLGDSGGALKQVEVLKKIGSPRWRDLLDKIKEG